MHLVAETFFTLHCRRWEAIQACQELNHLIEAHDLDLESYPALNMLLGSIQAIAGEEGSNSIVEEQEIAHPGLGPDEAEA